jgi:hypothetical protein
LTAYPNPFREYAKIKYTLPEDGTVNIEVTGILGNRVQNSTDESATNCRRIPDELRRRQYSSGSLPDYTEV